MFFEAISCTICDGMQNYILSKSKLKLRFDSRTYLNVTAVTEEVNRIKDRPNLLLWLVSHRIAVHRC